MQNKKMVLISTYGSSDFGFGHIKRSLDLASLLEKEFLLNPLFLVNKDDRVLDYIKKANYSFMTLESEEDEKELLLNTDCELLIIDKRDTDLGFYKELPYLTLALDNYGSDSKYIDYVINPLPYYKKSESNFSGSKYMVLSNEFWKAKKIKSSKKIRKILVSFGGADPSDAAFLIKEVFERIKEPYEISIVLGPLYKGKLNLDTRLSENVKILASQESLIPLLQENDLLLTSFGLTAHEAAFLNMPVLLINPAEYHEQLSAKAGFPSLGVRYKLSVESCREKLLQFIHSPSLTHVEKPLEQNINFRMLLTEILKKKKRTCPVCNNTDSQIVKRDAFSNLYYCEDDQIFFREKSYTAQTSYSTNYFVDDYKKQYGKTYEEDKDNIDRLNKPRVEALIELCKNKNRKMNLLEVGCALGFFLKMAQESGRFDVEGVEISSYAAAYASHRLKLKVENKDFLKQEFPYPYYDVVSMWYYIEHNKNFHEVLNKVKKALKPGGIFALSTPNAAGISARKDAKSYATRIPEDHYYEFSPKALKALLEKEGFKLIKVRYTGIHPRRWFSKLPKIFFSFFRYLMRKKGLGDTFEAYFQRLDSK